MDFTASLKKKINEHGSWSFVQLRLNTAFFPNESCRLPTWVYILLRSAVVLQGQMYEAHDELFFQ